MLRDLTVETLEETEKLLVALPAHALRDHRALQHVQRSEQRRRPVALVVVGHRSRAAALERQARLGPVQSLDLALLVHAQHKRVLGRIPVQAHNVPQLFHEPGVVAQLERLDQMGLQPVRHPDALDRRRTDALGPSHRTHAPVGLTGRLLVQRRFDHFTHDRLRERRLSATAGTIPGQPRRSVLREPTTPQQHRGPRNAEFRRNRPIGRALRRSEHDPATPDGALRRRRRLYPFLEKRSIALFDVKSFRWFPHERNTDELARDCQPMSETLH